MVIFHCFLYVYQRVLVANLFMGKGSGDFFVDRTKKGNLEVKLPTYGYAATMARREEKRRRKNIREEM